MEVLIKFPEITNENLSFSVIHLSPFIKTSIKEKKINGEPIDIKISTSPRRQNQHVKIITVNVVKNHIYFLIIQELLVCSTDEFVDVVTDSLAIHKYFKEPCGIKVIDKLSKGVSKFGNYSWVWTELTSKPDYNMEIFKCRRWPYFNINSIDWKQSRRRAVEYPVALLTETKRSNAGTGRRGRSATLSQATNTPPDIHTLLEEVLSQKNNNFLGYEIEDPHKYGDVKIMVDALRGLKDIGQPHLMLELFCRWCISPPDCHIIKSPEVWAVVNTFADSLPKVIHYYIWYAQYIMRHEETVMFSQVNPAYRVIYTHREAAALPPFKGSVCKSPYIHQLTGDIPLNACIPLYLRVDRRITSVDEFNRRFYLATGGALEGINMQKLGCSVSGSILIPCNVRMGFEDDKKYQTKWIVGRDADKSHYFHHAPKNKGVFNRQDLAFLNYIEYLYPGYQSLRDTDYKKILLPDTFDNINKSDGDCPDYNKLSDIDIAVKTKKWKVFDEVADKIYKRIRKNCAWAGPVYIKKIERVSGHKWSIGGPGLIRPIDVFRVPYGPLKMVKKFYLACVMSCYEPAGELTSEVGGGSQLFQSCVNSLLSGVNPGYKGFSCNKVPVDSALKYVQRGISLILNESERVTMLNYCRISPRWSKIVIGQVFGEVSLSHRFFHPGQFSSGIRYGLRQFDMPDVEYMNTCLVSDCIPMKDEYGEELIVKTGSKIIPPSLDAVKKYISRLNSESDSDSAPSDLDSDLSDDESGVD